MKTKTKYDLNHAEVKLQSISDKKNKIWKSVQSDYHRVLRKTYNSLFKIHTGIRHVVILYTTSACTEWTTGLESRVTETIFDEVKNTLENP